MIKARFAKALRLLLATKGYQAGMADSPAKVLDAIANPRGTTSGQEGLNLLVEN